MIIGAVLSMNENIFTFKGGKIIAKLRTPVFQILVQDMGITCVSKKIEFSIDDELKEIEAKVMGKKFKLTQLKGLYNDLKSELWLSTQIDNSDIHKKLIGYAEASKGKVLFVQELPNISSSWNEIQKIINLNEIQSRSTIKQYCSLQIEQISKQIRTLTSDKNMYSELLNTL